MRNILSGIVAVGLCFSLIGCSESESENGHTHVDEVPAVSQPEVSQPAVSEAVAVQTAEVGCGSCIFEMEGVFGCPLAVKIDNKPYLVTGSSIDAHTAGLCAGAKQAEVAGKIEGDRFVASQMELKP